MRKKGSMITVQGDGRTIARNTSFFNELSKTVPNSDRGDIQDDDFNASSYNPPPVSPDVSVIPCPNASNPVPCKTTNAPSLDNPVHPERTMPASFFRPLLTVSFLCLLKSCLSSAITSAYLKQTSQQSTLKKRLPALPKVEMSFQSLRSVSNLQTSFRLFEFSIQTLILSLVNFLQDLDLSIILL